MYGCSHSSIIGFVSHGWLSHSPEHSVFDGAPSPITGKGRIGQKNADLLLCHAGWPRIAVEVETQVHKYPEKLETIESYLGNGEDYPGMSGGLMVMLNLCLGKGKFKHNWGGIKDSAMKIGHNIGLVSIEKERISPPDTPIGNLRRRNDYYPWGVVDIEYWFCDKYGKITEGTLWKKL